MRPLRLGQTTWLLLSFCVGFFIARATPAPVSLGHQDHQAFLPPLAPAFAPAPRHVHWLSFDAGRSITTSVLKPTPIAMQPELGGAPSGRSPGNADAPGSIVESSAAAGEAPAAAPEINRERKGDRLLAGDAAPVAPIRVATIASGGETAPPPDPNHGVLDKQREIGSPQQDAQRPAVNSKLALAATAPAQDLSPSIIKRQTAADALPPIIIGHTRDDHDGGDIDVFAAKYQRIKKSGRRVVIDGLCFSACTIVASLPKDQVCVTPKAALGVHMVSTDDGPDVESTQWAVKKFYPPALQEWIKKHGGLAEEPKYVKGSDLLTIFNSCKKGV